MRRTLANTRTAISQRGPRGNTSRRTPQHVSQFVEVNLPAALGRGKTPHSECGASRSSTEKLLSPPGLPEQQAGTLAYSRNRNGVASKLRRSSPSTLGTAFDLFAANSRRLSLFERS